MYVRFSELPHPLSKNVPGSLWKSVVKREERIIFLKLNMKDENVFYRYIYLYDNNKNIYKL